MEDLMAKLEALLFIQGESLSLVKAAEFLEISPEQLRPAAEALRDSLRQKNRGLMLIFTEISLQLVTKPEWASLIKKITEEDFSADLSSATLETLSIICYNSPVSKAEIEYIRGVNSTFILRNLILRGLVERRDRGVYQVSAEFLKHLGLFSVEQLPEYKKYSELKQQIQS